MPNPLEELLAQLYARGRTNPTPIRSWSPFGQEPSFARTGRSGGWWSDWERRQGWRKNLFPASTATSPTTTATPTSPTAPAAPPSPTDTPGELPADAEMVAEGLFFSPSLKRYFALTDAGFYPVSQNYAMQVLSTGGATGDDAFAQRQLELAIEQQKASAQAGGFYAGQDWQAQQAEEFENWRNRLVNQLSGPANEVSRWFVQHKPNPYVVPRAARLSRELQEKQEALASLPEGSPETSDLERRITQVTEDLADAEASQEAERAAYEAGPATPSWLPELVPGLKGTLGIRNPAFGQMPTPSGQQLNRLLPSQGQFISGAIDWYGGKPWGDILAQADIMQPRTPSRSATRWRPPSQTRIT